MKTLSKSQHALLGLLTFGSASGYDLNKLLEVSLNHFWRESYGQIYPSLKRLEATGLAESNKEAQEGKPDRTVYSITPKGRDVFRQWLKEPASLRPPRNELLLKFFFAAQMSKAEREDQLRRYQVQQQEKLEMYREIEHWLETNQGDQPNLPYWLATVNFGRLEAEAHLLWCEQTLQDLAKEKPYD